MPAPCRDLKVVRRPVILDQASLHIKPGMRVAGGTQRRREDHAAAAHLGRSPWTAGRSTPQGPPHRLPAQEIEEISDHAVLDEVLASYAEILSMEHRLKELGERITAAYTTPPAATASSPADNPERR